MPYGLCVASGAIAGSISLLVLAQGETPRAAPQSLDDLPIASSISVPRTVALERSANLMFDDVRATPRTEVSLQNTPAAPLGVTLPVGQIVTICFDAQSGNRVQGRLDAADGQWLQIVESGGKRTWVAMAHVVLLQVDDSSASARR